MWAVGRISLLSWGRPPASPVEAPTEQPEAAVIPMAAPVMVEAPTEPPGARGLAAAALRMATEPATLVIPVPEEAVSEPADVPHVVEAQTPAEEQAVDEPAIATAPLEASAIPDSPAPVVEAPTAGADVEPGVPTAVDEPEAQTGTEVSEAPVEAVEEQTATADVTEAVEVVSAPMTSLREAPALANEDAADQQDVPPDPAPATVESQASPVEASPFTAELRPRDPVAAAPAQSGVGAPAVTDTAPPGSAPGAAPPMGLLRRVWMAIVDFFRAIFGI